MRSRTGTVDSETDGIFALLTTLVLVISCLLVLSVVGLCVLSALPAGSRRDQLIVVSPLLGAALIAVVTNWSCRWLSAPQSVPLVLAVTALPLVWGVRLGRVRSLACLSTLRSLAVGPALAAAGLCVAAVPVMIAGDINPVAASYNVDQLYFAGVSTWLMDNPLLPGPVITDSWVGDSVPSSAPAADTVYLKLRFGQSAISAVLSGLLAQSPFQVVTSMSLVWLVTVAASAFFLAQTLGADRRVAAVAGVVVTSSFFVVTQALEGKNDGLLGVSLALAVLALCYVEMHDNKVGWPLVLVAAGLVASYSEYLLLLVPILLLLAVLGPREQLLHRLNQVAWPWALTAVLVPMAWVWLVKSFKQTTRFTDGPTPFSDRSGLGYVRAAMGLPETASGEIAVSVLACLLLAGLTIGWWVFLRCHPARGALIGLLAVVVVLEINAFSTGSGNLTYRVAQLTSPALIGLAVVGWGILIDERSKGRGRHLAVVEGAVRGALRRARLNVARIAVVLVISFVVSNLTTTALATSHQRASEQHVPKAFTDVLLPLVDQVGWENVSVVAPKLTDVAALSLALATRPAVQFPVIPNASSYVGTNPLWDSGPDRYYVVGPGARVIGGHTTHARVGDYRVVSLKEDGLLITPFQTALWPRVTWMRGFLCGRQGLALLVLRGGIGRATFDMATMSRATSEDGVRLERPNGKLLRTVGRLDTDGAWQRRAFIAPKELVSILTMQTPSSFAASGTTAFPLEFIEPSTELPRSADRELEQFCLQDANDGSDGYDRELTLMRGPW